MKQNTKLLIQSISCHILIKIYSKAFEMFPQPIILGTIAVFGQTLMQSLIWTIAEICELLFTRFNVAHPKGFGAHSMSVSDIIVIFRGEESRVYYCDPVGFKKINYFSI